MHRERKHYLKAVVSIVLLGLANTAPAVQKPVVAKGELAYVICADESIRVRDNSLSNVLFSASPNESVKVFQGWGENKKTKEFSGHPVTFVRAQFGGGKIGWIGEKYVKLKSLCTDANAPIATATSSVANSSVSGLGDSKCCRFPINHEPLMSYTTGERQFGALRANNRVHAAADLYGSQNEPIVAVAPGVVVRGLYDFYYGTYAIDVRHPNFVVRYGEVSGKKAIKANTGDQMAMGEVVAHMGQLIPKVRPPMLHFELYKGNMVGPLSVPTTKSNKYGRRKDLIDPTNYLQRWESKQF